MTHYDAIVIGSGQAGTPLAKKLAQAGKKTALIEKRYIGGTCVNAGCTPTKAMIASARAAYLAARCTDLGVTIDSFSVDMAQVKKRKDEIVAQFRGGSEKGLKETDNLDLIFGEASFTGQKALQVLTTAGTQQFTAPLIFINTGGETIIPDVPGLKHAAYLTSTTILDLETAPEHLLIIGGSYIGLEFGQMFRRFGSEVTILEQAPRALPHEDDDIAASVVDIMQAEGISYLTGVQILKVTETDDKMVEVLMMINGKQQLVGCSHILVATGRKPQTPGLMLQNTGVTVNDKGFIMVDDSLQTNVDGIYALGDVKGGPAFTHISYNDYTIVYRNLVEGASLNIKNRLVPYSMFTDPQLGRVGLTEAEARRQGLNIKVATLPMASVARAIETGDTRGMMKAVVDADTKLILGVAVLGQEGGEIMSVLQMAMAGGITYEQVRYMVFAHPLYSESLNNLFMSLDQ